MKLAALETIHMLYPEQDWLHVYTDNSGKAGAGIYCKLYRFYLSLGQHATHIDGEREALTTALIHLGLLKRLIYSVIQFQRYSQ
jgi:hypothetical protein